MVCFSSCTRFGGDVFASPTSSPVTALEQPQMNGAATPQTDDARASARLQRADVTAGGAAPPNGTDASLTGVTGALADLTAESSGFSDNEKRLLQQMRKMQVRSHAVQTSKLANVHRPGV